MSVFIWNSTNIFFLRADVTQVEVFWLKGKQHWPKHQPSSGECGLKALKVLKWGSLTEWKSKSNIDPNISLAQVKVIESIESVEICASEVV